MEEKVFSTKHVVDAFVISTSFSCKIMIICKISRRLQVERVLVFNSSGHQRRDGISVRKSIFFPRAHYFHSFPLFFFSKFRSDQNRNLEKEKRERMKNVCAWEGERESEGVYSAPAFRSHSCWTYLEKWPVSLQL